MRNASQTLGQNRRLRFRQKLSAGYGCVDYSGTEGRAEFADYPFARGCEFPWSERGVEPVSDPLIARFAEACGATGPLDLRVDLAGGGVLAEGSVAQPFTLVGRDDACDVTLSDPEVNMRHAW